MNNGAMTGGGVDAGTLALLQNGQNDNNWGNNPFAYLIWLVALGRNGLFGGDSQTGAAVSNADAIRGIQESVNAGNLASCQNTNAIQAAIAQSAADAAACCCNARIDTLNQAGQTREAVTAQGFASQLGFANTNASVADKFAALQLQNCVDTRDLQAQLAACCCENQKEALRTQNEIDKQACATQNLIQMQTMTLTQENNRNTQAILDRLNQQDINLLNDRIDEKNQEIDRLRLENSQNAQNNTLVAALQAVGQNIVSQVTTICGCSCQGSQVSNGG